MKKLIEEIHRRSLWQVLGIYLAGSYGALEVVGLLAENIGLPEWFPGLAFALLVLGLPVVVATAFVQQGTGRSDARAADASSPAGTIPAFAAEPPGGARGILTWRNAMIGGTAAALLWAGVAVGWLLFGRAGTGAAASQAVADSAAVAPIGRSIAVLPFATRSQETEDRYFAEGMHDDLLTQLAKIDSLTVISRTSVMQFAQTTKTIGEIAEMLQVATILEGGVQRSGDSVRVNVQLIDAATDRHLWAETYDEELTVANVFAIQRDLAHKIAEALHATLSPAVERRLEARPTESLEAFDLYSRGRYAFEDRGAFGEDLPEVIALFEGSIAADSSFAHAWAGLADAYIAAWNWRRMPRETGVPRARRAVDRAIALDPELAEAHVANARLLRAEGLPQEALQAVLLAVELQPGSARAHSIHAAILQSLGKHEEAVRTSRRAVELDPLSVNARHLLTDRLYFAGDMDDAIAEARKVLEMSPGDWYSYYNIGWAEATAGRITEAVQAFHAALGSSAENADAVRMGLGFAFARGGQRDSALSYVRGFEAEQTGYDLALVYFEVGDEDRAFQLLESALRAEPDDLGRMRYDPAASRLRADPRFAAMVRRLGLD